jgi:hypothetical protein
VANDATGNAIAVWRECGGIWANRFTPGSGWGLPELIETNDNGRAERPQVAMDASGDAVAVWYKWDDGYRASIWAIRFE